MAAPMDRNSDMDENDWSDVDDDLLVDCVNSCTAVLGTDEGGDELQKKIPEDLNPSSVAVASELGNQSMSRSETHDFKSHAHLSPERCTTNANKKTTLLNPERTLCDKNNQESESRSESHDKNYNQPSTAGIHSRDATPAGTENVQSRKQETKLKLRNMSPKLTDGTPLERFRPGYLWVSDLTRQNWCEQQLYYTFTVPTIIEENPVMTQGTDLHLARELAVHDVVHVQVTSSEDIWAIKVVNLLAAVQGFLNGVSLAREVPIFGTPFGEDIFMVGLIDELQFDPHLYTIDLRELKTRQSRNTPSKSQKGQHRLQVMLYKKLFDDLVKGVVTKKTVAKHLKLHLEKEFGESVQNQIGSALLTCKNLNALLDYVFAKMQCLTCVSQLSIEYVHQESKETLSYSSVEYDEEELKGLYRHYLGFWRGQREVVGVDIEDAWKCQRCDFEAICEWRERKSKECSANNKQKNKML